MNHQDFRNIKKKKKDFKNIVEFKKKKTLDSNSRKSRWCMN